MQLFLKAELLLSIFIILTPFLLDVFLVIYHLPNSPNWIWIVAMFFFILPVGILTGFELPSYLEEHAKFENYLLFINYSGSLIASFTVVYLYSFVSDYYSLALIAGTFNFMAAIFILKSTVKFNRPLLILTFFSFFFASVYLASFKPILTKMSYLQHYVTSYEGVKNLFYQARLGTDIVSIKTPYQLVDIIPASLFRPHITDGRWGMYLNHRIQFYSDTELNYHQTMTFFPLILFDYRPKNVLILGGGDLGLAREFARLKKVNPDMTITVVELDEEIINMAKNGPQLDQISQYHKIKSDINLIQGDAISFLRNDNLQKFDLILADFPFPTSFELGRLYSTEFFKLIYSRVSGDGFFVLDFPFPRQIGEKDKLVISILINSLRKAGFNHQAVFGKTDTFVLNSKIKRKKVFNYQRYEKYITNYVLTNLIDNTDKYSPYFNYTDKVHSIFRPAMEFKIDD